MKERKTPDWQIFWLIIVILILHDALIVGYYITFHKADSIQMSGSGSDSKALLEDFGPAPDFNLPDPDGNMVRLSGFSNQVVLVNFWGTWCPSCCDELPDMDRVYRKFKDKGFALIGIAVEFDRAPEKRLQKVKNKVNEMGIAFPVVMGDAAAIESFGGKPENFPQTYLIDRHGKIRKIVIGARQEEYWERLVQKALSE